MVIAVDVDLTVVDTLQDWIDWYKKETGEEITQEDLDTITYNVDVLMKKHSRPMLYWENPNLYDKLEPIPNSVEVLKALHEEGNEIIFVSSCFWNHAESKEKWLDKWFPFHSGFIATHHKEYVRCDAMIDDYDYNLNKAKEKNSDLISIKMKNNLSPGGHTWLEIYDMLKARER